MDGISLLVWLAAAFIALLAYWFGRGVQKHFPWFHFRPWKWREARSKPSF